MTLPFTADQFLEVFKNYNLAIWPMQIIAYVLGIAALLLTIKRARYSGRMMWGVLSFYWLWMGGIYHLIYFASINPAAYGFGLLFIVQGILFAGIGVSKRDIRFRFKFNSSFVVGVAFILYAMLGYPILGHLSGHGFPHSPIYGVAPCPTTIFTYGILLWAEQKIPRYILVIPTLWSVIGFLAAIYLDIHEDIGLLVAGVIGVPLIVFRGREYKSEDRVGRLQKYIKAN
jgi:hypothetical protein